MNIIDAINVRHSSRKYLMTPIDENVIEKLVDAIKKCNETSGLNMQLVINNGDAFNGFTKSYGLFSGVRNYIALIGRTSDENFKEKTGYFGEKLALEATMLGLGTCWVGGTFDKKSCSCSLQEGEDFLCVIVVGNTQPKLTLKEKLITKVMHGKIKQIQELYDSDADTPKWFINGISAVQKAPSAINKQPVTFHYNNEIVTATIKDIATHEPIDMGIAKLHFEIGAGDGSWEWGNGGKFYYSN